jgi:hypothetical protein
MGAVLVTTPVSAAGAAVASMAALSGPWGWAAIGIGAALGGIAGVI